MKKSRKIPALLVTALCAVFFMILKINEKRRSREDPPAVEDAAAAPGPEE